MEKEIWQDGSAWQGHQRGYYQDAKRRVKIVKVLYFAEVKEILNMSNEYIDILEPKTVKEIRQLLNQYHPELMDKNSKLQSMKNLRKKTV